MSQKTAGSRRVSVKPDGGTRAKHVRALDRGLAVLEVLAAVPGLSLTATADEVGLPYSTTHRLLETLKQRQFVIQSSEGGLYSIGLRAFEVGARYLSVDQLPETARMTMQGLEAEIGETVNLAVRDGREAVYIFQVEGRQKVRMFTRVGARTPLHCSGVGKVLLAWQSAGEIADFLAGGALESYTAKTLTDSESLGAELRNTAVRGYAVDFDEYELGIRCVAAPVRNQAGEVIAAISVSGPLPRFSDERIAALSGKVVQCAWDISARLGWIDRGS